MTFNEHIYIYGMGRVGVRTFISLREKGVSIEAFIDSSITKQGRIFEGVECISPEKFCTIQKDDSQVIVALEDDKSVSEKLKEIGIRNLIFCKDISKILEIQYEPITELATLREKFLSVRSKNIMGIHNNENIACKQ